MVAHYTLTLTGSAQTLTAALASGTSIGNIKQLILHADPANTHVVYVGGNGGPGVTMAAVDSSTYGFRIEVPVSTVPPAPTILEAINTSLGDWQVLGTNTEKLHITVITQ